MKQSMKWAGVGAGILSLLGIGFVTGRARAGGVPDSGALTYSGLLHDAQGAPLGGPQYLEIQFWDDASETSAAHLLCDTGTPAATPLVDGRFSIPLPDDCAKAVASKTDIFVDVIVGGSRADAASLGVRTKLGAVPYALEAANAARFDGKPPGAYQLRVADGCPEGQAALGVNEDGSVQCGAFITPWTKYTPRAVLASTGFPAAADVVSKGWWRRVGDSIEVMVQVLFNSASADDSAILWSLPDGVEIDPELANAPGGVAELWNGSAATLCAPAKYPDYPGIAIDCQGASSLRRSDVGVRNSSKATSAGIRYSIPVSNWTLTSP